jgi:hypothetical protein
MWRFGTSAFRPREDVRDLLQEMLSGKGAALYDGRQGVHCKRRRLEMSGVCL